MTERTELSALRRLVDRGAVVGMKVETESEGLPWLRIGFLSALASAAGIEFVVKVGGCEAKSDLKNCDELGVSGVVGPMIETVFAASKFHSSTEEIFEDAKRIQRYVLIESWTGVLNAERIIDYSAPWVNGINVGRSDLAKSMTMEHERPHAVDDDSVIVAAANVIALANQRGLQTTMGGRLTPSSVAALLRHAGEDGLPQRVETRRFILRFDALRDEPGIIDELLQIELGLAEQYAGVINRRNLDAFNYAEEIRARFRPAAPQVDVL